MKKRSLSLLAFKLKYLFIISLLFSSPLFAKQQHSILLEAGAVWQHRNDVKILPDSGTYFEFDKFNQGPLPHYRLEAFYRINENHSLRLIYAPFDIDISGRPDEDINYNGQVFSSSQDLDISYKFNSYRIGYAYQVYNKSGTSFQIGVTGKIRDADIELKQGALKENYSNVGFVPLFYLSYENNFSSNWSFYSDIDFASAPQGRAIDFNMKLRRKVTKDSSLGLGYRTIEGGADNEKVFTFSWFNYAVMDFVIRF